MLPAPGIRVRITAWAALAAAIVAIGLTITLQALLRRDVVAHLNNELAENGRLVTRLIMKGQLDPRLLGNDLIQVVDGRGVIVSASAPMVGYPVVGFPPPRPPESHRNGRNCHVRAPGGRCFLVSVDRLTRGRRQWLIYSLAPEPGLVPDVSQALVRTLPIPVVTILTGFLTWTATSRALRPVDEITAELDEITAADLERRVPEPGRKDEVARLARSVNSTLDRLEGAVARLRGFVSDVSHELRSPLTGLRMEVELALTDAREAHSRETLETLLDGVDRLQAVLDDLLAMARLESGRKIVKQRIDLQELADQCVLDRPRRARFTVEGGEPVVVRGGRSELHRLLTNLVDNADRHAAGAVTLTVRSEPGDGGAGTAVIEVYDDGPGIAPEDRERVFERFTRLSEGRHRDAGGTGLGLAIARDIASAHGGSLVLTDRPDGLSGARFILRLPMLPPERPPPRE